MIEATHVLLAPREDVWALVAEAYHLPDWWPGYTGVQPDRRGLAEGARWRVVRSRTPGLVRKPRGEGLIVLTLVARGRELRWHDIAQRIDVGVRLEEEGSQRTHATVYVDGPFWRIVAEGVRGLPKQAVSRLYDLCQTAASL